MKSMIQTIFNKLGYQITKLPRQDRFHGNSPYSTIMLRSGPIIDLDQLAHISRSIPGMITPESGQFLYAMCYMQDLSGDVVEIGSWQGRSTSFLARAVKCSGNGKFYAIDHFKGNVGKEHHYAVGKHDLSDLEKNFLQNMKALELSDSVNLLNMTNEQAEERLRDVRIRFLFIDGDHTKAGVEKDIALFFPKLMPGSIVVFDDFSRNFPGLVDAVDTLIERRSFSRVMAYQNTLVVMI